MRRWDDYQFTTWFEPYMPTFNFDNAEAVAALIDNSAWWAKEYDLDGFRLDAVKHIPNDFWWKFRSALRERGERKSGRSLFMVGETFQDRAGIGSFVGPNMLDGQFDFPLYDSIKECFAEEMIGLDKLETSLTASEESYGKESLMSPLIGNHDKGRFMAYADRDLPDRKGAKEQEVGWIAPPQVDDKASYEKIKLAHAFLLAIDGVPMIYYGDEFGMTGAGDPDNRRDMRFGDAVSEEEQAVLRDFEKLTKFRTQHSALRSGSRRTVLAKRTMRVGPELDDGDYVDALTGKNSRVENREMRVELAPRAAAFFVRAKKP